MEKRTLLSLKDEQPLNMTDDGLEANHRLRLEKYNASKSINAFIAFDGSSLFADVNPASEASLPLFGLPFSCKDNINAKGFATTAGTPGLMNFYPSKDAPIIARLKALGAVLCGKNNMHELSFGVTSRNGLWGSVENPVHPGRIAGGSSGGSAAAVAAGVSAFSLGTDTGGSVRIPAALCGLAGFRPSTGRYPCEGIVPVSRTKDTPGFIAASVSDLALLDSAVMDEASITPRLPLRIGLPTEFMWRELDKSVQTTCMDTISRLGRAGVEFIKFDDSLLGELNAKIQFPVPFYEFFIDFPRFLLEQSIATDFDSILSQISDPAVFEILQKQITQNHVTWNDYITGLKSVERLRACWYQIFNDLALDAIMYPTVSCEVPRVEDADNPEVFHKLIRNTDIVSSVGGPSLTIPIADKGEMSVGLSLDGLPNADRKIISHALAIEAILQR